MRKSNKHLTLLLLGLVFLQLPAWVVAATPPANLQPLEEIPPPALGAEDSVDEPQITIIKKKEETVEEYRLNGQLYMMKITPSHGVPYYLYKEDQEGAWLSSGPNPPLSVPKWTIFRF